MGDFEIVADNFTENSDEVFIFWLIFVVGTLISLLIILNMVIAIMGGSFSRVDQDKEAYIYRAKLSLIIYNYYRFSKATKHELNNKKYMVAIEVDPVIDPIEKDSPHARINQRVSGLEQRLDRQSIDINHIVQNLDQQSIDINRVV